MTKASPENFDAQYYERYYHNPDSQAVSTTEQENLTHFIVAYLRYLQVPVSSILDVGCGIGTILRCLKRHFPEAKMTGVEFSEYLCAQFGWHNGSVVDYHTTPADLVICSDVLGYLDNRACKDAINNLANLTKHALYLAVLTSEDLEVCDKDRTDMNQTARSTKWYRRALHPHFQSIGGGLFLRKPVQYPLWQLEQGT
ncbi:MAG: class I SAM-dependent methyltransferase [Pseudomonadota bacterium]